MPISDFPITTRVRPAAGANDEAAGLLSDARDSVDTFHILLEQLRRGEDVDAAVARLRRDVHNLKLLFAGSDERLIDLVLQRFSNYLALLTAPEPHHLHDLAVFIDLLEAGARHDLGSADNEAEFARSLPVMRPADLDDLRSLAVEVLLVDPQRTSARLVARELQSCGYRVVIATRSYEALEVAARTRPDLVISSSVLDEVDGLELGCMLHLARATTSIPFALLTSMGPQNSDLRRLPPGAGVIRKDGHFADDLARELARFGLM